MHVNCLAHLREVRDNVLMYLDWNAFGKLIVKAGAEFKWGG